MKPNAWDLRIEYHSLLKGTGDHQEMAGFCTWRGYIQNEAEISCYARK